MPRYVIERDLPESRSMSPSELKAMSQKSMDVLMDMGPEISWVHSYIADDKIYCVYIAPDEDMIMEHAKRAEFPVTRITRIDVVADPTTAEMEVPASAMH
jgi:hypothetical protein